MFSQGRGYVFPIKGRSVCQGIIFRVLCFKHSIQLYHFITGSSPQIFPDLNHMIFADFMCFHWNVWKRKLKKEKRKKETVCSVLNMGMLSLQSWTGYEITELSLRQVAKFTSGCVLNMIRVHWVCWTPLPKFLLSRPRWIVLPSILCTYQRGSSDAQGPALCACWWAWFVCPRTEDSISSDSSSSPLPQFSWHPRGRMTVVRPLWIVSG